MILCAVAVLALLPSAYQKELTHVHIIPHSHCDPGWRFTVNEYYEQDVKLILKKALAKLYTEPRAKFVFSEVVFWERFVDDFEGEASGYCGNVTWGEIIEHSLATGQLEFVGGGFVQQDEALTTIDGVLTTMFQGHSYLLQKYGYRSRVGWQIDTFGHSSLSPAVFTGSGMDAVLLNRVSFKMKFTLDKYGERDFIWVGDDPESAIFSHIMIDHYNLPVFLNFEVSASTDVNEETMSEKAQQFLEEFGVRRARGQRGPLLYLWGDDFHFSSLKDNWGNIFRLVDYINANQERYGLKLHISTFTDFYNAVLAFAATDPAAAPAPPNRMARGSHSWAGEPLPPRTPWGHSPTPYSVKGPVDLLPYHQSFYNMWSGFFSTYMHHKRVLRVLQTVQKHCSKLLFDRVIHQRVMGDNHSLESDWVTEFKAVKDAVALLHHHDAITGTSAQHVMDDYLQTMYAALHKGHAILGDLLGGQVINSEYARWDTNEFNEDSIVDVRSGDAPLKVCNSLGFYSEQLVSLLARGRGAFAVQVESQQIGHQVKPLADGDAPQYAGDSGVKWLQFIVAVPPSSCVDVLVTSSTGPQTSPAWDEPPHATQVLENKCLKVRLNRNGDIRGVSFGGHELGFKTDFVEFYSFPFPGLCSGHYVLRTTLFVNVAVGLGFGLILGQIVGCILHRYSRTVKVKRLTRLWLDLQILISRFLWNQKILTTLLTSPVSVGGTIGFLFIYSLMKLTPNWFFKYMQESMQVGFMTGTIVTFIICGVLSGFFGQLFSAKVILICAVWVIGLFISSPSLHERSVFWALHEGPFNVTGPRVYEGPLTSEVTRVHSANTRATVTVPKGDSCYIDIEYTAGSALDHQLAAQFIMERGTSLFTSNGRSLIERTYTSLDFSEGLSLSEYSPIHLIGDNFFPLTTSAVLRHPAGYAPGVDVVVASQGPLAVGTFDALGGSHFNFVLHRNISSDDQKGLMSGFLDNDRSHVRLRLFFERKEHTERNWVHSGFATNQSRALADFETPFLVVQRRRKTAKVEMYPWRNPPNLHFHVLHILNNSEAGVTVGLTVTNWKPWSSERVIKSPNAYKRETERKVAEHLPRNDPCSSGTFNWNDIVPHGSRLVEALECTHTFLYSIKKLPNGQFCVAGNTLRSFLLLLTHS